MNTECRFWRDDDDGGSPCRELTRNGRTHCEAHREQELQRLWRRREDARRARDLAEQDYMTYLSEGYSL